MNKIMVFAMLTNIAITIQSAEFNPTEDYAFRLKMEEFNPTEDPTFHLNIKDPTTGEIFKDLRKKAYDRNYPWIVLRMKTEHNKAYYDLGKLMEKEKELPEPPLSSTALNFMTALNKIVPTLAEPFLKEELKIFRKKHPLFAHAKILKETCVGQYIFYPDHNTSHQPFGFIPDDDMPYFESACILDLILNRNHNIIPFLKNVFLEIASDPQKAQMINLDQASAMSIATFWSNQEHEKEPSEGSDDRTIKTVSNIK